MRRRIVALLQDHPEGLTPAEMRTRLGVDKRLADTCLGMLRYGLLRRVECVFHGKAAADARRKLPLMPRQSCRRCQGNPATDAVVAAPRATLGNPSVSCTFLTS
jgi:hypothetical protein